MSIPKLAGLETEFAITGGEDRISASWELVNAYSHIFLGEPMGADPYESRPANACAGSASGGDWMLPNGARFYVDHAHPEYSTPESLDAVQAVALDHAGNEIVRRCADWVNGSNPGRQPLAVYKNNSDHQGNSYGCHENYLVDASTYKTLFAGAKDWICTCLAPFLVSRIIYIGAGKVGAENGTEPVEYQISQRADFFEEVVGLQTTYKRPIVNTRDEPHADARRFRRLHVIAGDSNMCPYAAWLKIATMQILLRMLEDGRLDDLNLRLDHPVQAMQLISRDPTCRIRVRLADGRELSATEIQHGFLECAHRYFGDRPPTEAEATILREWESTIQALRREPDECAGKLDWVTKRQILTGLASKGRFDWVSPQAIEADVKYHALDSGGIFPALKQLGLVALPPRWDEQSVSRFLREPPGDSRAYLRGTCIDKFATDIVGVDWGKIVFRSAELDLPDPVAMNRSTVESILRRSGTFDELLRGLDGAQTPQTGKRRPRLFARRKVKQHLPEFE